MGANTVSEVADEPGPPPATTAMPCESNEAIVAKLIALLREMNPDSEVRGIGDEFLTAGALLSHLETNPKFGDDYVGRIRREQRLVLAGYLPGSGS